MQQSTDNKKCVKNLLDNFITKHINAQCDLLNVFLMEV